MQPEYRHDRSSLLFAGVLLILAIGLVAGPLQSEPLSKPEQLTKRLKSETEVLPTPCGLGTDIDPVSGEVVVKPVQPEETRVCSDDRDSKFVRMLRRASRQ